MGSPPSLLPRALALLPILAVLLSTPAQAQYSLSAPSGLQIELPRERLLWMNDTTEALRENLETDPRVLYFTAFADAVESDSGSAALPWNAVEVLTDSSAAVLTPGNLREADRAYANYAVLRMQAVRLDPDVGCDELVDREVVAVEGFVDGWVVARTLFGGPPYPPLDELAFAREAGVLRGLIAAAEDSQLGGCLRVWSRIHDEEIERYREWRTGEFLRRQP